MFACFSPSATRSFGFGPRSHATTKTAVAATAASVDEIPLMLIASSWASQEARPAPARCVGARPSCRRARATTYGPPSASASYNPLMRRAMFLMLAMLVTGCRPSPEHQAPASAQGDRESQRLIAYLDAE